MVDIILTAYEFKLYDFSTSHLEKIYSFIILRIVRHRAWIEPHTYIIHFKVFDCYKKLGTVNANYNTD